MASTLTWAPLEAQLVQVLRREDIAVNVVQMARRLNRDTQTVYHYRRTGRLNVWAADRYACSIGLHPALVWGNDWWTALTDDMSNSRQRRKKQPSN
jgi:hypothetical protein